MSNPDVIDIRTIIEILLRQKRVIVLTFLTLVILSVLVTSQLTPAYTGRALLLIDPRQQRVVNIDEVVTGLPANSATVSSEVEVIKSDRVAIDVIRNLDLLSTSEFAATPSLIDWIGQVILFAPGVAKPEPGSTVALVRALEIFRKRLTVSRRGLTYVIEVAFTSRDPKMAARVVNTVTQTYLNQLTQAKLEVNQRAANVLRERLTALSLQLRLSEIAVDEFMSKQVDATLLGNSSQDFEQALLLWNKVRQDAKQIDDQYQNVRKQVASGDYLAAAALLNAQGINALLAARDALVQKEGRLRARAGGQGRELFDLQNQLRSITLRVREEVATENDRLRSQVARVEERRQAALENVRSLTAQNRLSSGVALELWKLQQNTQANRALYETFLSRLRQTEQLQNVQFANSRVISAGLPPIEPSFPRPGLIFVLTAIFSAAAAVGVGFLKDYFAQDMHDEGQLEQASGIMVVASIPLVSGSSVVSSSPLVSGSPVEADTGAATPAGGLAPAIIDIVVDHPQSVFAEAVRRARIGVDLAADHHQPGARNTALCVMITAALSGEGKSTLAVLLARSWAQAENRVALVDFDFRRPQIHRLLGGAPPANGAASAHPDRGVAGAYSREFLDDPKSAVKYIHAKSRLAGAEPQFGIGRSVSRRIIEDLKRRFDIIIIDAPPLLPVVDARLILPNVDVALFVVRAHATTYSKFMKALRDIRQAGKPVVAVLNGVNAGHPSYYGDGLTRGDDEYTTQQADPGHTGASASAVELDPLKTAAKGVDT